MNVSNPFENKSGGEIFAMFLGVGIALIVAVFLAIHTLNFFEFAFPAEQSIYAYLGFGLTGGGFLAYLAILKWGSKDSLSAIVAVIMIVVCGIGELVAFGFGLEVETYIKNGRVFSESEITAMVRFVQGLALLHTIALVAKYFGADVVSAFGYKRSNTTVQSQTKIISTPSPFPISKDDTNFPTS